MWWLMQHSKRAWVWRHQFFELLELMKRKNIELKPQQTTIRPAPERISRSVLRRVDHLLRAARRLRGHDAETHRVRLLRDLRVRLLSQYVRPVSQQVVQKPRLRLRRKQPPQL